MKRWYLMPLMACSGSPCDPGPLTTALFFSSLNADSPLVAACNHPAVMAGSVKCATAFYEGALLRNQTCSVTVWTSQCAAEAC